MFRRMVWLGFGLASMAVWAGCTQPVSQAYAPVPTPTPVPKDFPYATVPSLPADLSQLAKIDEAIVPGGNAKTIPLFSGFYSQGADSAPVTFYVFQADDATQSTVISPTTNLNRVTAAWDLVRRDGTPLAGQRRIFSAVPGEPGYFPYLQVHRVTVPDTVQPNQIRDMATILRALGTADSGFSETIPNQAINTVIVGENAVLQGNESVKPTLGWFNGRRAYYLTFDTQPVRDDGTVAMNPMWAPQPGLVGRPGSYDRTKELQTISPFFTQVGPSNVLTDAILDTVAPTTPAGPTASPTPTPAGSPAPSIVSGTYSGVKALSYFPMPQNYQFRSITTKNGIPNFSNIQPAKFWLNAPLQQTVSSS